MEEREMESFDQREVCRKYLSQGEDRLSVSEIHVEEGRIVFNDLAIT